MDVELRSIYERCDVSNNGTDSPMSFEEFKQWHQQEISKARIDEARYIDEHIIGAPRKVTVNNDMTRRIAELSQTLKESKEE